MPAHKNRSKSHHRRETITKHTVFDGLLTDISPFGKHVNSTDALLGAGLGLGLGAGVKYLLNRANVASAGRIPAPIMTYAGPISTFLGGVVAYLARRGSNRSQAEGLLAGASVAALAPIFWSLLGSYGPKLADGTPFFSDYILSPYGALTADQGYGALTADQGYGDYVMSPFGEFDAEQISP